MKKMYKAMLLVLCAMLLVAGSVMGTLAYLQDKTDTVTNTMSVGKVEISLSESKVNEYGEVVVGADPVIENSYKLIPGLEYTKDPTVTVKANSEACYVFVKVVNGIEDIEADTTIADQISANHWTALDGVTNVYYIGVSAADAKAGKTLPVFGSFKIAPTAEYDDLDDFDKAKITVNAYAIQSEGFGSAKAAWVAANFS